MKISTDNTVDLKYPLYCSRFVSDTLLLVGGGGGEGKNGVPNKLSLLEVKTDLDNGEAQEARVVPRGEYIFEPNEDCVMSFDADCSRHEIVAGVNRSSSDIAEKRNDHLRTLKVTEPTDKSDKSEKPVDYQFNPIKSTQIFTSSDPSVYQKFVKYVTVQSSDGKDDSTALVVVSSDDEPELCVILNYGTGKEKSLTATVKGAIIDISVTPSGRLGVLTTTQLTVFDLSSSTDSLVESSAVQCGKLFNFGYKYARFAFKDESIAVVAYTKVAGSVFIAEIDVDAGKLLRTQQISRWDKGVTGLALAGNYIAVATSSVSVILLSPKTLRVLMTFPELHSFAITSLDFNPAGTLLVSTSAAHTLNIIRLPASGVLHSARDTAVYSLLSVVLIAVLAVVFQKAVRMRVLEDLVTALESRKMKQTSVSVVSGAAETPAFATESAAILCDSSTGAVGVEAVEDVGTVQDVGNGEIERPSVSSELTIESPGSVRNFYTSGEAAAESEVEGEEEGEETETLTLTVTQTVRAGKSDSESEDSAVSANLQVNSILKSAGGAVVEAVKEAAAVVQAVAGDDVAEAAVDAEDVAEDAI